jgi:hypothetical protein
MIRGIDDGQELMHAGDEPTVIHAGVVVLAGVVAGIF